MKFKNPLLTTIILIIFTTTGCSQQNSKPCDGIAFKYYDTVLNDLKTNGKQSIYFDSINYADYDAMAYLDIKSSYITLKSINPRLGEELGQDSSEIAKLIKEAQKENIPIDLNSIADLFCNKENLKFVLRKHTNDASLFFKLGPTIYIKDNTAYFTIYGTTWSDAFLATYSNKNIELTFLYGIQE